MFLGLEYKESLRKGSAERAGWGVGTRTGGKGLVALASCLRTKQNTGKKLNRTLCLLLVASLFLPFFCLAEAVPTGGSPVDLASSESHLPTITIPPSPTPSAET